MTATSTAGSVWIVVPAHRPPADLCDRLRDLRASGHQVVVVDDGSGPTVDGLLNRIAEDGTEVERLRVNSGIAAALNRGVQVGRDRGAEWVLTLDQDSLLPAGYVDAALAVAARLRAEGERVLAVGPGRFVEAAGGPGLELDPDGAPEMRVLETIQSGLLFDLTALREVGPFDESLFMDCIDTEMVLRGAARGFGTFRSLDCTLVHQLGETRSARLPSGRVVRFSYHGPVRRYYITRNRSVVWSRFLRAFPRAIAGQMAAQARSLICCLVFGPHRGRQVVAVVAGAVHSLSGRRGRIPARLARLLAV